MDTGRLGWARATRSQVVLVKNVDSQAYPRPAASLGVGPRGSAGPSPASGPRCQPSAESQLPEAHVYTDWLVLSLPSQLSLHRDSRLARGGQTTSPL